MEEACHRKSDIQFNWQIILTRTSKQPGVKKKMTVTGGEPPDIVRYQLRIGYTDKKYAPANQLQRKVFWRQNYSDIFGSTANGAIAKYRRLFRHNRR